ncbi:formimidoylglutamate deiminase [Edaphobacter aggregans]|uniref:Formimidoylglutamate deiminase n=1 Tax=Edaphobacter aggregans TaxID=570835 RepID=A0A3R9PDC2_9BACT|nr:formimidoylglutamate deiminase [Edaphobacter aggregans]RSL19186.1 formimidoylglutamate deiminase [Edaphobacter aggregans]
MNISYQPDLLFVDGGFKQGYALEVDDAGTIVSINPAMQLASSAIVHRMPGRALLPGMIDIHSHSFQRALRGKAESRHRSGPDFWSWRNIMYRCALALTPEEIYDVARLAFLEMTLAGITTVGEFHYLHRTAVGSVYDDPNLLAKQVIRAADSVGIRIVLLRCAYARAGFNLPTDPGQIRFIEPDADMFLRDAETLRNEITQMPATVGFGLAPHSVRAVPREYLNEISAWAHAQGVPLHMHVAEQPAEINACVSEYGVTPFHFLDQLGLLTPDFTAIHAIHLQPGEIKRMARGKITVGACPTTERNLGDGILRADELIDEGVSIAFGTDSHTQTDPLENARELESNLRLLHLQRAVLDGRQGEPLPGLLFDFATRSGARSLHANTGSLELGKPADFFTIDLSDCSLAGSLPEELLTNMVFSMSRSAVCDVVVAGRVVIDQKRHAMQDEIIAAFHHVQQRLGTEL